MILLGTTKRRHVDLLNLLAVCAGVLLLIRPEDLFDVGAQLSFLAVAAILLSSSALRRQFTSGLRRLAP